MQQNEQYPTDHVNRDPQFVSSDRSSYIDDGLLYNVQLFEFSQEIETILIIITRQNK